MKYSSIAIANKTLLYMLIFTIIASTIAFTIVVKAYDDVYALSAREF